MENEQHVLVLKIGSKFEKIAFDDLIFIQIENYLLTFVLKGSGRINHVCPLKEIITRLPPNFFQISRSCIVNLNEISSINNRRKQIVLKDSTILRVSDRRMLPLIAAFTR